MKGGEASWDGFEGTCYAYVAGEREVRLHTSMSVNLSRGGEAYCRTCRSRGSHGFDRAVLICSGVLVQVRYAIGCMSRCILSAMYCDEGSCLAA
jgi:hypothetical protein